MKQFRDLGLGQLLHSAPFSPCHSDLTRPGGSVREGCPPRGRLGSPPCSRVNFGPCRNPVYRLPLAPFLFFNGLALAFKPGSEEWITFMDLAAVARRHIPEDIMADEQLVRRLPLVFRTLRGQKVEDNLDALLNKIRGA